MLKLDKVNVWHGNHHVLQDLSCNVDAGDFVVILGTNGAGKTTFFDTIAGKMPVSSGSVYLDGQDVTALSERERAGIVTRIFQNTNLNSVSSLTVFQNLAMAHYSRRCLRLVNGTNGMPRERATGLLADVGMHESILDKPMKSLSGGQRQLIAFIMATQLIPKILLLDEPTAALDPQAATTLLTHAVKFIKQYKVTTLLITHDPHIALSVGNKIWVLDKGRIVRRYGESEKASLTPSDLIGHIDYRALTAASQIS